MTTSRQSKIPPAEGGAAQAGSTRAQKGAKSGRHNRALRRLAARFNSKLSEEARAYFASCVTTTTAMQKGRLSAPSEYIGEFLGALDVFRVYIEKKAIPGYGPMRARYGIELLQQAVPLLDALDEHQRLEVDAADTHRAAVSLTDRQRLLAGAAFRAVLSGDAAPSVGRDAATPKSSSKRDRMESAEVLASEVARAKADVPADVLEDAGLGSDALSALSDQVGEASDKDSARNDTASARQLLRAQLAEPCGRIRAELQVLLAGVRAARKVDPSVPRFTSALLNHSAPGGSATSEDKSDHEPVVTPPAKPPVG